MITHIGDDFCHIAHSQISKLKAARKAMFQRDYVPNANNVQHCQNRSNKCVQIFEPLSKYLKSYFLHVDFLVNYVTWKSMLPCSAFSKCRESRGSTTSMLPSLAFKKVPGLKGILSLLYQSSKLNFA